MASRSLVQARIDSEVKARASLVLEGVGLTISDAVRILLTRTATEGALPFTLTGDSAGHDAWFRAKVMEALQDPSPEHPNDEVEAYFAGRRLAAAKAPVAER